MTMRLSSDARQALARAGVSRRAFLKGSGALVVAPREIAPLDLEARRATARLEPRGQLRDERAHFDGAGARADLHAVATRCRRGGFGPCRGLVVRALHAAVT